MSGVDRVLIIFSHPVFTPKLVLNYLIRSLLNLLATEILTFKLLIVYILGHIDTLGLIDTIYWKHYTDVDL